MASEDRYKAFISYAHVDEKWAQWLHKALEAYSPPRGVVTTLPTKHPFRPIFRDRDELTASTQLGVELQSALEDSSALIVICSPKSAASHWVNEEIRYFREKKGIDRIFALIVDGEPYAADGKNCFPAALLEPAVPGGTPLEPLAADARKTGDGKRSALLKIAAGLLGVGLDQLARRDAARRQRRLLGFGIASTIGMVLAGTLAVYANIQRILAVEQRQLAERNERAATATVDYLIGTFRIANPATENANSITAATILTRGMDRIESDLRDEPAIQAKLYSAIGEIYTNLRLLSEAETALAKGYAKLNPDTPEAIDNRISLATVYLHQGKLEEGLAAINVVLEDIERLQINDPGLNGRAYEIRGHIQRDMIAFASALEDLDRAFEFYEAQENSDDRYWARINSVRGRIMSELKDYESARAMLSRVLDRRRSRFSDDHFQVAIAYFNLGVLERNAGNLKAAQSHLSKALGIYEKVLTPPHPELASLNISLGRISQELGDLEVAVKRFEAATAQLEAVYPDGHYSTGYAYVYLALVLSEMGEFDRALTLIADAVPQYVASYGETNPDFGDLAVHKGVILARAGRQAEAAAACREGIDILDATLGEGSPITADLRAWCVSEGALEGSP